MRILRACAVLAICSWTLFAQATVTFQNAAGITRRETIEEVEHLFAGMAGACSGSSPCNTCAGSTGLKVCNESSIGTSVIFRLEAVVTASTVTSPVVVLRSVTKNAAVPATMEGPDANGVIAATITWGDLCSQLGTAGCTGSFTDTLQFGIGDDSSEPDDKIEVKLFFSHAAGDVNGENFVTACQNQTTTGEGICYFQVDRGDEKVYLTDIWPSTDFPSTGGSASGVRFVDLMMYFEPSADQADDAAALARITTSSSSAVLGTTGPNDAPLNDDRVVGLTNGQRYCFAFANRDNTGNIYRFSRVTNTTDYPDTTKICATPEVVVGLLDDKKCFIATAAWGSPFDPHVKDLRAFRDRYLLTHAPGRAFVSWYYANSPGWADWISTHDEIRSVVRAALWPAWIFVKLILVGGLIGGLLAMSGIAAGLTWWLKRRRAGRPA